MTLDMFHSGLPAIPAHLVAAVGYGRIHRKIIIYPDRSSSDSPGNGHGFRDVLSPDSAGQAEPSLVHPELPAMCDIVIASETAAFQDGHFQWGIVPDDGCHVIWPMLLGQNRGRHFLLSGRIMEAQEAKDVGLVSEIVAADRLMDRARHVARDISLISDRTRRYTRMLFAQPFKRALNDDLALGLALEGLARWNG